MGIDRKSSIETEPRTLNFQQIQSARDAALYVVKSRTMAEANQIFTEGMLPTTTTGSNNTSEVADEEFDELEDDDDGAGTFPSYISSYIYHHFGLGTLKDVLTAPF